MPAVIRPAFHHVTIKTSHLQQMVDWYVRVVGAKVNFQDANNAWTTNDEANHRVAFLSVPGLADDPEKTRHNGMHHSAFEYASFADLMSSYDRLKGEGILPAFCLDHGLTISLYYEDPEGNFVELQSDNFSDWKRSTEFMQTSLDFQRNPIGTFFDPGKGLRGTHGRALLRDPAASHPCGGVLSCYGSRDGTSKADLANILTRPIAIKQQDTMTEAIEPADRLAIEALIYEFGWLIDHGEAQKLPGLFTDDGRVLGVGPDKVGQQAIGDWGRERAGMRQRRSRHVQSNIRLQAISASVASGTVILTLYRHDGEGPGSPSPLLIGDYQDVYERGSDDRWRFSERSLTVHFGG